MLLERKTDYESFLSLDSHFAFKNSRETELILNLFQLKRTSEILQAKKSQPIRAISSVIATESFIKLIHLPSHSNLTTAMPPVIDLSPRHQTGGPPAKKARTDSGKAPIGHKCILHGALL